ncbi:MAG: SAVED domain-containing protein [Lachnospiraceae bacterium]|nr:SAVED domain-containing protein [Lachnospiraceae bacterium]
MKANSATDLSVSMVTAGISLVCSAFPGTKEMVLSIIGSQFNMELSTGVDYVAIVCGALLIVVGIYYRQNIKDRIFVLNMLGLFAQHEISDTKNVSDLKLEDFKVKEVIVDFVDIFDIKMTEKINDIIVRKIEKQCTAFVNRSKDFKSCFTGMAPIPYTILAGTYLGSGNVRRYFEYKRAENKFYELKTGKKRKTYDALDTQYPSALDNNATDVVVALSITRKVNSGDLIQFAGMDVVRIDLPNPDDNIITTMKQLDKYAMYVLNQIEDLKQKYPYLQKVHFVASIPSCVSLELGKLFAHNNNRLPQIISYHYVHTETPKYSFGIVITDKTSSNRGKLVKG